MIYIYLCDARGKEAGKERGGGLIGGVKDGWETATAKWRIMFTSHVRGIENLGIPVLFVSLFHGLLFNSSILILSSMLLAAGVRAACLSLQQPDFIISRLPHTPRI